MIRDEKYQVDIKSLWQSFIDTCDAAENALYVRSRKAYLM